MTTGYAITHKDSDEIYVETISNTIRAAKVNWLVVSAGIIPLNTWSDNKINDKFDVYKRGAKVIKIRIEQIEMIEEA